MAQVSMTGKEFEEFLQYKNHFLELLAFLKEERKVRFTPESTHNYTSGDFPSPQKFPEFINELLTQDMVEQLLCKDSDEFAIWARTGHHYYNIKDRELNGWTQDRNVNLLEVSPVLKERWNLFQEGSEAEQEDGKDGE
jgi:hypothetical protein